MTTCAPVFFVPPIRVRPSDSLRIVSYDSRRVVRGNEGKGNDGCFAWMCQSVRRFIFFFFSSFPLWNPCNKCGHIKQSILWEKDFNLIEVVCCYSFAFFITLSHQVPISPKQHTHSLSWQHDYKTHFARFHQVQSCILPSALSFSSFNSSLEDPLLAQSVHIMWLTGSRFMFEWIQRLISRESSHLRLPILVFFTSHSTYFHSSV